MHIDFSGACSPPIVVQRTLFWSWLRENQDAVWYKVLLEKLCFQSGIRFMNQRHLFLLIVFPAVTSTLSTTFMAPGLFLAEVWPAFPGITPVDYGAVVVGRHAYAGLFSYDFAVNEKLGQQPCEFRHKWGYGMSTDRHLYCIRGVSE